MANKQKPLYFFLHIPKTGGTSIAKVLNRLYRSRYIPLENGTNEENRIAVINILKNEPNRYDVIGGHVGGFGIHEGSQRPVRYLTILRDPGARAISLYYMIMRVKTHRRHAQFQQYGSIEEGLTHIGSNLQTRVLAGIPKDTVVTAEHLELAKRNIEEWFDAVAILERFDESLILMRRALGWKTLVIAPPHENAGKNRPKALPESVIQLANDLNAYDTELYEFANALMDKRIRELGFTYRSDALQVWARREFRTFKATVKKRLKRGTPPKAAKGA